MNISDIAELDTPTLMELKLTVQAAIDGLSSLAASRLVEGFPLLKREQRLNTIKREIAFQLAMRFARRRKKKQLAGKPGKLEITTPTRISLAEARQHPVNATFRPNGNDWAERS